MNKKVNELDTNEEIQVVTLEDSEGNEIVFEVISTLEYNGKEYIVLLPFSDYGDPDEYTILEISVGKNGNIEEFYGIDNYNTLTAVYKKFCQEYDEE